MLRDEDSPNRLSCSYTDTGDGDGSAAALSTTEATPWEGAALLFLMPASVRRCAESEQKQYGGVRSLD